jgi:TetR/AcrR family transcriptional regulator, repressor of fatR-cypB operon
MTAAPLPFYIAEDDPPAKREILRAALKLFSERGLAATSIRDIADESGFTNPALYKHYGSKEELALHLFETCHRRVWSRLNAAVVSAKTFDGKLQGFVGRWLEMVDEHPDVVAFLSDSARVLWPKASAPVRRQTVIGVARSVVLAAPKRRSGAPVDPDVGAAILEGTLAEMARMLEVGVVDGPAARWKGDLVNALRRLIA